MPIEESNGCTTAQFGNGDIAICVGRPTEGPPDAPRNHVVLVRDVPNKIGEWTAAYDGKSHDEVDAPIRMIFDSVDSVDVMIERLQQVKKELTGEADSAYAVAGPAWRDVAASAYRAYSASTGNKNFRGEDMPAFQELPIAIRIAWEAVVRQVGDVLRGGIYGVGTEQRWEGWVPPREASIEPGQSPVYDTRLAQISLTAEQAVVLSDRGLAARIVSYLNELIELDRNAIAALIANRIPCNDLLASHPSVQVGAQYGGFHVGLLGILNGLCGVRDDGQGLIAAIFETPESPGQDMDLCWFEVNNRTAITQVQPGEQRDGADPALAS